MSFRILVSLDGTPQAERALRYAEALVRSAGGELKLCRATVGGGPTDDIERAQDSIARRLRQTGVPTELSVVEGPPVPAILQATRTWQPDFITMATTRSSGLDRWWHDGVVDAIVRSAEAPVLVVPPDREHPSAARPPTRILVPLDGSAAAEKALGPAGELSRSLDADLILLRVIEEDGALAGEAQSYIQTVSDGLRAALPPGAKVVSHLASGSPGSVISQAASELGAGLIVMSTHGRGGVARAVLGSVATGTLEHSSVPVVLVGPAMLSEHAEPGQAALQDPAKWTSHQRRDYTRDAVEEQGWQSFPASDPPSWTGATI